MRQISFFRFRGPDFPSLELTLRCRYDDFDGSGNRWRARLDGSDHLRQLWLGSCLLVSYDARRCARAVRRSPLRTRPSDPSSQASTLRRYRCAREGYRQGGLRSRYRRLEPGYFRLVLERPGRNQLRGSWTWDGRWARR